MQGRQQSMGSITSPVAAGGAPASLSPSRRAWLRFKRNRLGYWSLLVFCALVLVSLSVYNVLKSKQAVRV